MVKTISIANQKGGVGKTTTAINLGAALAEKGKRVVIVDFDPQGNASTGLGVLAGDRGSTTYDVLVDDYPVDNAIIDTNTPNLRLLPATGDLSSADVDMAAEQHRLTRLRNALAKPSFSRDDYDYVFIDCPPSLSVLTLNAFATSDSVLVPLQAEFFALEGLSQLILTVREVRENLNPNLHISSVVLTMVDKRNRLSGQVEADAREHLGDIVYDTVVPRNVRLSEAPSFGIPATEYDPSSKGAEAYKALADEFLAKMG
ncbi:MAG: AAA family ATPase [Pseudomonadota bacterium]